MVKYKYTAVDLQKQKFTGTFIAKDEKDLAVQLVKQNLFLVSATPYKEGTPSAFWTAGTGKVDMQELTTFCRQFAIMINSGIQILECLESLKDQPYSGFFKNLLQVIYDDVKGGIMLSEALNKHKKVFPDFFRSMVYVGEASGKLDLVFNSLADYYEKDNALRKKTRSAFSYPIMLMVLTVGIVILMLAVVIPTFRETLSSLEVEITGLTAVVYGISDFLTNYWLYCLAGIVFIVVAIMVVTRTRWGSMFFARLAVRTPGIRNVVIDTYTARFARGFGLLLSSGMDVVDALETISIIMENKYVANRFKAATEDVKHGVALAVAFEKYHLFPQLLIQMITVGEKTAALDEILERSCNFFDTQVENTLNGITSKIQPILLIIMGAVIGSMFVAVYSPMLSIMQGLL